MPSRPTKTSPAVRHSRPPRGPGPGLVGELGAGSGCPPWAQLWGLRGRVEPQGSVQSSSFRKSVSETWGETPIRPSPPSSPQW